MRRAPPVAACSLLACLACDQTAVPGRYRDIAVPTATITSPEARSRGRALFLRHCALCHGERANGLGARRNLSVRPADFTDAAWRARVTPRRVFYVIREGIRGTPMPAWKTLSEDASWDLAAYILSVADQGATVDADLAPAELRP